MTRLLIALCFIVLVFGLSVGYQAIAVFSGVIIAWGLVRAIPSGPLVVSSLGSGSQLDFFLMIIHSVSFNDSFVFNQNGLQVAGRSFFKIGSLGGCFLMGYTNNES